MGPFSNFLKAFYLSLQQIMMITTLSGQFLRLLKGMNTVILF